MAGLYTTIDEVRGELQELVDDSVVTDDDLTRWIRDAGRWIDAHLSRLYAVPILTPLSGPTELLEEVARDFVVARALRKHFSDRMSGEHNQYDAYEKSARDGLTQIMTGNLFNGYALLPTVANGRTIAVILGNGSVTPTSRIDVLLAEHDRATGVVLDADETAILQANRP
jgi:hypothetical protein